VGDRAEAYSLLRQLRDWEMSSVARGLPMPAALRSDDDTVEVTETVDLTNDDEPIDIDSFIIDVLIVREVRVKRESDAVAGAAGPSSDGANVSSPVKREIE